MGHVDITFYFGWNLRLHGLQHQCSGVENVGHVDITLYFGWEFKTAWSAAPVQQSWRATQNMLVEPF